MLQLLEGLQAGPSASWQCLHLLSSCAALHASWTSTSSLLCSRYCCGSPVMRVMVLPPCWASSGVELIGMSEQVDSGAVLTASSSKSSCWVVCGCGLAFESKPKGPQAGSANQCTAPCGAHRAVPIACRSGGLVKTIVPCPIYEDRTVGLGKVIVGFQPAGVPSRLVHGHASNAQRHPV